MPASGRFHSRSKPSLELVLLLDDDRLEVQPERFAVAFDRDVLPHPARLHIARQLEQARVTRQRDALDRHRGLRQWNRRQPAATDIGPDPTAIDQHVAALPSMCSGVTTS